MLGLITTLLLAYILLPIFVFGIGIAIIPVLWIGLILAGPILLGYLLGKRKGKEEKKK